MERALEIGMSGLAARASGINIDSRFDFPDNGMRLRVRILLVFKEFTRKVREM